MPLNEFNSTEINQSQQCLDTKPSLNQHLVRNIEEALSKLDGKNPFIHYNIDYSSEEVAALRDFTLIPSQPEDHKKYDTFISNSTSEITKISNSFSNFLNHISSSKDSIKVIVSLIEKFFLAASYNNEPDEITLLEFRTGPNSDTTWHTDTLYKSCMPRNFITLKGPTTLFYNDQSVRDKILKYNEEQHIYNDFPEQLIDYSKVEQAIFGQGSVFIQGEENAALHAGPANLLGEERLVLVIDKCNLIAIPEILADTPLGGYSSQWTAETV